MKEPLIKRDEKDFIESLKHIVSTAQGMAYASINYAQVQSNWLLGQRIVEQMQKGKERAEYGSYIIKLASEALTEEFGKGYSESNIRSFRMFYLTFSDFKIQQTLSAESEKLGTPTFPSEFICRLSWSHYERLLLSQVKEPIENEMKEKTAIFQQDKLEFIKNPTVLEFLGLPNNKSYKEKDLEKAILDNMSDFLMELGKGFAFVARQQLIRTETEDYYIDLVFYNYLLKAFVLVDLKVGKITHQDVGQMDMYVRMYDELKRTEGDNPTIGILLCSQTDKDIARYSILKGSEQIFTSKYQLLLPSEEELANEIRRQKEIFSLQNKNKID